MGQIYLKYMTVVSETGLENSLNYHVNGVVHDRKEYEQKWILLYFSRYREHLERHHIHENNQVKRQVIQNILNELYEHFFRSDAEALKNVCVGWYF